jgi:hypothetical protein
MDYVTALIATCMIMEFRHNYDTLLTSVCSRDKQVKFINRQIISWLVIDLDCILKISYTRNLISV